MITTIDYTSPTSWTDLDMDWSDTSTDISCQKSKYLDAIRLAILERQSVCGLTGLDILYTPDYIPYPYKSLDFNLLILIHDSIRRLIPYFVNHTINNGDFTGLDIIPMWTERDILDYLEIDTYEYPQPYIMDNTKWIKQQYKIINLLKWCHAKVARIIGSGNGIFIYPIGINNYYHEIGLSYECYKEGKSSVSWNDAYTQYINGYFSDFTNMANRAYFRYGYYKYPVFGSYKWTIVLVQMKYVIHISTKASIELYSNRTNGTDSANFYPLGPCTSEHLVKVKTLLENNIFNFNFWDDDVLNKTDFYDPTVPDPQENNVFVNDSIYDYIGPDSIYDSIILKFTGPNGFKFRGSDW